MIRLQRLEIEAYRSLYSVVLELRPLTVVVGPNNAGKSNLVDAIDFLGEIHRHGLELAIQRKGGFENIAHRRVRRSRRPVAFRIDALVPFEPGRLIPLWGGRRELRRYSSEQRNRSGYWIGVHHEFELRAEGQAIRADYSVVREELRFKLLGHMSGAGVQNPTLDESASEFLTIIREGGQVSAELERPSVVSDAEWDMLTGPLGHGEFSDRLERLAPPTELLLGRFPFLTTYEVMSEDLASMRVYQLAPLECRRSGVPTPNADLDRHGGNLPALVDFMQKHHPEAWSRVEDAVRRILPDLEEIRVINTPDRRLALQFLENGAGRPWTSDEVSDGTIQSVALFSALHDPRVSSIVIEEPENSVHPWILRVFVDACRAVEGKSVVLTTHSPVLIDYVDPDEILMIWRQSGRSQLAGLDEVDPDARALWAAGTISLFEIIDGGWIRQAVPVGDL